MMSNSDLNEGVFKSDPQRLAKIIDFGPETSRPWTEGELQLLLQYRLNAPMGVDLGGLPPEVTPKVKTLAEAEGLLLKSLLDLFCHEHAPLELLRLVKDYAKAHRNQPQSELPREVSAVIYYASIAAALVSNRAKITRMPEEELRSSFDWALSRHWSMTGCTAYSKGRGLCCSTKCHHFPLLNLDKTPLFSLSAANRDVRTGLHIRRRQLAGFQLPGPIESLVHQGCLASHPAPACSEYWSGSRSSNCLGLGEWECAAGAR